MVLIGFVGSGVGVQLCVLKPSFPPPHVQIGAKTCHPTCPLCLPRRYGVPRELGAVLIRGTQLRVIIPRVHADRTVAQFRVQATAVGVGPRSRAFVVGVGVGVLVLAQLDSAHARRARGDAAQAPADSLLQRYLSNTDLKHMTVLEAVLPDESSKAKLVLTRCQPLQPLLGLPHQSTTPEHTVACAASLDTKAVVLRVSLLADNHFSLEYTAPLSAFQALCVALTLCAFSLSQPPMPPSHHPTPTTHTPPNPALAAPTPRRVPRLTCALVHVRQGAHEPRTTGGGPDFKSVHSKTFYLKTSTQ